LYSTETAIQKKRSPVDDCRERFSGMFFAHWRGFHAIEVAFRKSETMQKAEQNVPMSLFQGEKEEGLLREKTDRRTFLERGSPSHLQLFPRSKKFSQAALRLIL
jgi:hypothetical protein